MKKHIPLTISTILDDKVNFYIRLRFYREFIDYQNCTLVADQPKTITTYFDMNRLSKITAVEAGGLLGITRQT